MFRLAVIHQLVLSLVVGPMLCCCTTVRLGFDRGATSRAGETAPRKHCCGGPKAPTDNNPSAPGDKTPGDPTKCPCKDGLVKVVATPETPAGTSDLLALLTAVSGALDRSTMPDQGIARPRPPGQFGSRSSSVSTADLLYAHHNLRC